MVKLLSVREGSIPWKKGMRKGSGIIAINGVPVNDQFDAIFQSSAETLAILVQSADGIRRNVKVPSASFGDLVLEPLVSRRCGAHCIFCFVDQLPPGLRKTLYHKDEDHRFSYLYGNYVAMANIREEDLEKIVKYRLSPLYISVHATDPAVRGTLLGFKKEKPVMPVLQYLASNRITMHCQVVLCKGINDRKVLERTIQDLVALYPFVNSLSVVPVGITGFRQGLHQLDHFNRRTALQAFDVVDSMQKKFLHLYGTPFVYLSDEFYLMAGRNFPSLKFYGDLPQAENGVGLFSRFENDATKLLSRPLKQYCGGRAIVVTGAGAHARLAPWIRLLSKKTGIRIKLVKIDNGLFGGRVTVTGLICGKDILRALRGGKSGILFVPDVMLRDRENTFLDDLTLDDLSRTLKCDVSSFEPLLSGLYRELRRHFIKYVKE